jgi:hypothetical protein
VKALRTAAVVLLIAHTAVACSSSDSEPGGSDGADSAEAWCHQLDELWMATSRVDDLDVGSPGFTDAMTAVDDHVQALDDLAAPDAIADDWILVRVPPTADATGRIGVDDEQQAAGERVAAWALEHCELSAAARAALED